MARGVQKNRIILALLAVVMAAGLFMGLPATAYADEKIINISQSDSVSSIQSKVQNAIDSSGPNDTVTVTGSRTGVSEQLDLTMTPNTKIVWKATYSGSVSMSGGYKRPTQSMVQLRGDGGSFEVADTGSLLNEGTATAIRSYGLEPKIIVNGGTVKASNNAAIVATRPHASVEVLSGLVSGKGAIVLTDSHSGVIVSGGTLESTDDHTIDVSGSNSCVYIKGGLVRNNGEGTAIYSSSDTIIDISGGQVVAGGSKATIIAKYITVSGGLVQATGTGDAIKAVRKNAVVEVKGGQVGARQGYAILVDDDYGTLKVSGGFVFAYGVIGNNMHDIMSMFAGVPHISGSAVICAWNQAVGRTDYTAGSQEHLTSNLQGIVVRWNFVGETCGIEYPDGAYSGFYPVSVVTVYPLSLVFDSGGGSAVTPQFLAYGDNSTQPANPTRQGYTFEGWYKDTGLTTPYTFGTVYENTTVYARWTPVPAAPAPSVNPPSATTPEPDESDELPAVTESEPDEIPDNETNNTGGISNLLWIALACLVGIAAGVGITILVVKNRGRDKNEGNGSAVGDGVGGGAGAGDSANAADDPGVGGTGDGEPNKDGADEPSV